MLTNRHRVFCLACVLLLTLAGATVSCAREFGVTAGWNRSTWEWDESPADWEAKNGFSIGAFATWEATGSLDLLTEVIYTRKGSKIETSRTNDEGELLGDFDAFYNLDYIEIPFLAKYTFPTSGKLAPYFLAGPAVAFELSAEGKADVPGEGEMSGDLDETESTDISAIVGAGVEFAWGTRTMMIDVRYNVGLSEVYFDGKNRCLSVMAGVTF